MRLPTLLALLAAASLFAVDEPKTADTPKTDTPKAGDPAPNPFEKGTPKVAPKKAKKTMGIPAIPEGISIEDGVKLQSAWSKAQEDPTLKTGPSKAQDGEDKPKEAEGKKGKKGAPKETKAEHGSADEALEKAMLKADPTLKPELVHTFVQSTHQKGGERMKKAK